ncbi:MAG: hypothetical protein ACKVOQ_15510 [Cyclobacteriaceae bacterium]
MSAQGAAATGLSVTSPADTPFLRASGFPLPSLADRLPLCAPASCAN